MDFFAQYLPTRKLLFRFEHPLWLLALIAVPLAWWLGVRLDRWRALIWSGLGGASARQRLTTNLTTGSAVLQRHANLIALFFFVLALANPQTAGEREPMLGERFEVIIAIDISRSMNCTDAPPSRLSQAREFARKLLDRLPGNRVGLIAVAGDAQTLMPLTDDFGALRLVLDNLSTDQAAQQGTALGEALRLSKNLAALSGEALPAVVLVSDGEDHEPGAERAAEEARKAGIQLLTVGVGSPQGAPVPEPQGGYKKMPDGDGPVISRMDPEMLSGLAKAGGGTYFPLENVSQTTEAVMDHLSGLARHSYTAVGLHRHKSHFQWPLALGLLALSLPIWWPLLPKLFRRSR